MAVRIFALVVLALPAAADADPKALLTFEQLVPLSRQATKGNHPSPWNLVTPEAKSFPSVFDDGQEHIVFAAKLKGEAGRRDEVFRKSVETERMHGKVLEKKFDELLRQAKENPDVGPPPKRDIDLD